MPSSVSLSISSFSFKVRDVQLFFCLEHLEVIIRLLNGLISILLCLREYGWPEERERDGGRAGWWSSHNIKFIN
jgi:hypothetical protein